VTIPRAFFFLCCGFVVLAATGSVPAMDHVVFEQDGKRRDVEGRIVIKARDGGVLFQGRDGRLWRIPPDEQLSLTKNDKPFKPMTKKEVIAELLAELPTGFDAYKTRHYVILHNSSRAYAQWCGSMFERLYLAFSNYWKKRGFPLPEPEFPMVAVIFGDRQSYLKHARGELGNAAKSILGYYHLETNRMTMCDLTGVSSMARGRNIRSTAQINEILSRPGALMTVATIVHEATHQIAYNRGVHTRLSACPLWLAEGLAVFFETPDLSSTKGWQGIGEINQMRLNRFAQYLKRRPDDSLKTLIAGDKRFHNRGSAMDTYAEAWALTFYLLRNHRAKYLKYLRQVSEKRPLVRDTPEERVAEFEAVFGNIDELDRAFIRYMLHGRK
jgi:hypothetical protein